MTDLLASDRLPTSLTALALGLVRPYAGRFAFVLLLSVAATSLGLLQPWLTKMLIDGGIIAGNMSVVLQAAGLLLTVTIVGALLGAANRWLYVDMSARILFGFRGRVFSHLLTLSPRFFGKARTGDIMSRLDGDVAEVQRFALDSMLAAINASIMFIGSILFMYWIDPRLTLIAFALLPLEVLFLRAVRPILMRRTEALRERASDLSSFLFERISNARLFQSFSAEDRARADFDQHQDRYREDLLRSQMTSYGVGAVPGIMLTLSNAAVFVIGGSFVIGGELTLGALIAFSAYLGRATGPVQTFLGLYAALARVEVSLKRVTHLLDAASDVVSPATPLAIKPGAGEIRFVDVNFSHHDRGEGQLRSLSFTIPQGARIVLEGPSGAGKSTIVDLIQRHFDPDEGCILMDGQNLRDLDLADLRRRVVVVAQDVLLLRGSIADNLRLAKPDASDQELQDALLAADLGDLLMRLPNGLETVIGERGSTLSGGERQRFALARAVLCDPKVLILDEATAGLDQASEARVITALDHLFPTSTRIVISHHERALERADLRLRIEAGRVSVLS